MSNPTLLIHNGYIPTGNELLPAHLAISGTTISALTTSGSTPSTGGAAILDAANCTILPGFIDVHVHGALGADTMDADPAALARMARFAAHHGVTAFLPTTMTAAPAP